MRRSVARTRVHEEEHHDAPAPKGVDWLSTPEQVEEDARKETAKTNARIAYDLRPGDAVTYSWGPETLSPVQYNSVVIGPFSATVHVCDGETGVAAIERAKRVVDRLVFEELDKRVSEHRARAKR